MPPISGLSELEETVLLALWKLRGIGKSVVGEGRLREELPNEAPQNLAGAIEALRNQGFIEGLTSENQNLLSLTPLGLAILRKVEEDRLQELK